MNNIQRITGGLRLRTGGEGDEARQANSRARQTLHVVSRAAVVRDYDRSVAGRATLLSVLVGVLACAHEMTPYYEHAGDAMPRGVPVSGLNRGWFQSGVKQARSESHRKAIGDGQRRAWQTKRRRFPLGAVYVDTHGYVREKVVAGSGRWRLQHILRMEQEIGRPLASSEVVHHVNGDRANNAITNLYLCRDHQHHMSVERSLVTLFRELLRDVVVRFNFASGTYER